MRVFGLRPGQSALLEKLLGLANALIERADRPDSPQVDVRTFARDACGDSKALKANMLSVLAIVRRLRPDLVSGAAVEPAETLSTWGVVAMPHPLMISGALALDGIVMPTLNFFGLPPEDVARVTLGSPPAYVLTVENQASFVRHAREVNAHGAALVIYTGGFPSRAVLRAIVDLCERADAPTFHWGDLDAGGVRIFLHLEEALSARGIGLAPHLMSADLVLAAGTDLGRGRAVAVPSNSAIADLAPLVAGPRFLSLEQEAVAPRAPTLTRN